MSTGAFRATYSLSCADCDATIVTWAESAEWVRFLSDHFRTTIEPAAPPETKP